MAAITRELQQVNLFLPEFRRIPPPFCTTNMIKLIVVVILGMALIQLWSLWMLRETEDQLFTLQQSERKMQEKLKSLHSTNDPNQLAQLDNKIKKLNLQLSFQNNLTTQLSQMTTGNAKEGFASCLIALAKQHLPGLSINHIHLINSGNHLNLAGEARAAELVPQYVENLRSEKSFKNTTFGTMNIQQTQTRNNALLFQLGKIL